MGNSFYSSYLITFKYIIVFIIIIIKNRFYKRAVYDVFDGIDFETFEDDLLNEEVVVVLL